MYNFTCARCRFTYIGQTYGHFKNRIEEYIKKDNKFHVFKHIHSTTTCFDSYNSLTLTRIILFPFLFIIILFLFKQAHGVNKRKGDKS